MNGLWPITKPAMLGQLDSRQIDPWTFDLNLNWNWNWNWNWNFPDMASGPDRIDWRRAMFQSFVWLVRRLTPKVLGTR